PLSTIRMGVDLLLESFSGGLTSKQIEILTMCHEDAVRLERLVGDLLNLSKIESGQTIPRLTAVPTMALLRDAVAPLRLQTQARGLTVHLVDHASLPMVLADRAQIERVVANLVTNAAAATPRNGTVTIAAKQAGGFVAVSVSDTGRGIPREYLPRIFSPFVQ